MPPTKADLLKRFLASLIDGLLAGVVSAVFGWLGAILSGVGMLLAAGYILLRDGLDLDFADGRSIGKKIIGLRPVRLDGAPMTMETSIRRNWPLAIGSLIVGFGYLVGGLSLYAVGALIVMIGGIVSLLGLVEAVLVLVDPAGRRIGDKMAGTQVIEEAVEQPA